MKKSFLAISMVLLASSAFAADMNAIRAWTTKALPRCSDQVLTIEEVHPPVGPANFQVFSVLQTSSDKTCGGQKYLLYSPKTDQTLLGNVIPIPDDPRPADVRVTEVSNGLLKTEVKTTIMPFPMKDGLKALQIMKQTEFGPFTYHGFIDAGQHFLIIATRGSLKDDPGKILVESLGVQNGVRRGNAKSKVTIIELSDFQCPTCGRAHKTVEPIIAKALKKINYIRMDLPLFEHHQWSIYAALGARALHNVAPAKSWDYVNFVFGQQEAIDKQKFDDVLKNFCEDHDIDWKAVERLYRSPAEKSQLLDQVSRAFDNGINSTPTYIINGQVMGYGPEGKYTIDAIKKAIASVK